MNALLSLVGISIFIFCYKYLGRVKKTQKQMIKEIKNLEKSSDTDTSDIKKHVYKMVSWDGIQEKLNKTGNPLNLTPIRYIIRKVLLGILFFFSMYNRFNNIFLGILAAPVGFYLVDFLQFIRSKNEINIIRLDLADIYDSILYDVRVGNQLGIALPKAYESCRRSKRLRMELIKLAAEINMTADIELALDKFEKKFNYVDISLFVNSLKQSLKTGLIESVLEGQADQLKRKNTNYLKTLNNKIPKKSLVPAGIFFAAVMATILFTMGSDIFYQFRLMFS